MIELKAPTQISLSLFEMHRVFLAGSIEMSVAENWQQKLADLLKEEDVLLLNPRRDDWDSSWVQDKSNPQFNEQVIWEIEHLNLADTRVFYFDPNTKSPITLLELGLMVGSFNPKTIVVCCPEGFWRRGNVDILCDLYGVVMVNSVEELANKVKANLVKWKEILS